MIFTTVLSKVFPLPSQLQSVSINTNHLSQCDARRKSQLTVSWGCLTHRAELLPRLFQHSLVSLHFLSHPDYSSSHAHPSFESLHLAPARDRAPPLPAWIICLDTIRLPWLKALMRCWSHHPISRLSRNASRGTARKDWCKNSKWCVTWKGAIRIARTHSLSARPLEIRGYTDL